MKNNNKNVISAVFVFCIFSVFNAFAQTQVFGGCDSTCSFGSAVALRSQACTAKQEYRTTNCTAPQVGTINETRAPFYCDAVLVSGGTWRTISSNCTAQPSCTAQPTINNVSACPAGFSGTFTTTQTFDSTPAICGYNAPTNDSATACTPIIIPPSCAAQPTLSYGSACPAGFTGVFTTTQTFNNTPAICAYNPATNDSATACTPIIVPPSCVAQPTLNNVSACPAGFTGFFTTTQTFDSTPAICAYNAATNDSATACIPVPVNVSFDISANPTGGASMLITAGGSSCYINLIFTTCSMLVPANTPITVAFSPDYVWFGPGQIFYGLYTVSSNGTCDINNNALWGNDSCTFQTGPTGGNMFIYLPRCTNATGWTTCS